MLRNLNDVALRDDRIDGLYWYHSSTYESWPDTQAFADAHVEQIANRGAFWRGWSIPEQLLEQHNSQALHVGTYEAAIENMLRRLQYQDDWSGLPPRYWLHRVQLHLEPGDLAPGVGEEPTDWVGNVPSSKLFDDYGGARAVRYVNVNEAHGSISMAIHPAVIATVGTIESPVEAIAVETAAAVAATGQAVDALAEIAPLRPDTTGIDEMLQRFPSTLKRRYPDFANPRRVQIEAVAEQLGAYSERRNQIWDQLKTTLEAQYLPKVNDQVRRRFHSARAHTEDPAEYHQKFRLMASLLTHSRDVLAQFAHAPRRTIRFAPKATLPTAHPRRIDLGYRPAEAMAIAPETDADNPISLKQPGASHQATR